MLFMSRIHPKKGIDLLLEAWATALSQKGLGSLREGQGGMILVIAGADLIGYGKEVERMVREKGLGETVLMTGHVDGEGRVS